MKKASPQASNSSISEQMNNIIIGHVARAHGVKGDVAVVVYSDHPEQFGRGFVFGGADQPLTIDQVRPQPGGGLVVKFAGVNDRNAAEHLRGTQLTMQPDTRRDLDDDEFWPEDLVGLSVTDDAGTELGTVVDVRTGGSQDRLVVRHSEGVAEIPFVDELVPLVDLEASRVVVNPIQGLFEA